MMASLAASGPVWLDEPFRLFVPRRWHELPKGN
jgi:hypothetical protein